MFIMVMPMKILLIHDAPLDEWKGTQKAVAEYGNYLFSMGFDVVYLNNKAFRRNTTERKLPENRQVSFRIKDGNFKKILGVWVIKKKTIKTINPDVIYVSTFNSFFYMPFYGYPTVMGAYVIGPEHEQVGSRLSRIAMHFKKSVFRIIVRFYEKDKVTFHTLNPSQAKWLRKIIGNNLRIVTLPPPLDCKKYQRNSSKLVEPFTVTYLGALTKYKGFKIFSEAIHSLNASKNSDKPIRFNIIGTGELRSIADNMVNSYENVVEFGTLGEQENIDVLSRSHLLVSPSYVENFHYVTAEAQLCGLPVVSSDISGPRFIIVNLSTGTLVPVGDIKAIVSAIINYRDLFYSDTEAYMDLMERCKTNGKRFCKQNILPEFYSNLIEPAIKGVNERKKAQNSGGLR